MSASSIMPPLYGIQIAFKKFSAYKGIWNSPWVGFQHFHTFFANSIPLELQEAAFIDGCTNQTLFFRVVLPLSKPILAVLALYFAVGQWNSFFNALIYLNSSEYYPLQLILRSILLESTAFNEQTRVGAGEDAVLQQLAIVVWYRIIVVSSLPIIAVYPFLQKFFVKGVMIGAIKG